MVRPDRDRIGTDWSVEVDEALIGGRTRGEGRGVHHKELVIGALEVRTRSADNKKKRRSSLYAGRLRLRHIADRGAKTLTGFVSDNVKKGAVVRTDGFDSYNSLTQQEYMHDPLVLKGDPERMDAHLPMIHITFSNLKTWLQGTHHSVGKQHLQAYLDEFVFRYNRRFYPMTGFASILGIGIGVSAPTYQELYNGAWDHHARSAGS